MTFILVENQNYRKLFKDIMLIIFAPAPRNSNIYSPNVYNINNIFHKSILIDKNNYLKILGCTMSLIANISKIFDLQI